MGMQRLLDFILASLALIIVSPLILVIIPVLRVTGEGEVFFRQKRIGKDGAVFNLLKFTTMVKNSENIGTGTVTLKNDPRVLPVGRILRKTKLNELPQLWNVVAGDMSVVGPRPQTKRCFDAFPRESQNAIIKVTPGLTGIGSIVFRDEEEMMEASSEPDSFYDEIIMPYKGALEQWFAERRNLRIYFICILLTIWVLVFPRSGLVWKIFSDLPSPPRELSEWLSS